MHCSVAYCWQEYDAEALSYQKDDPRRTVLLGWEACIQDHSGACSLSQTQCCWYVRANCRNYCITAQYNFHLMVTWAVPIWPILCWWDVKPYSIIMVTWVNDYFYCIQEKLCSSEALVTGNRFSAERRLFPSFGIVKCHYQTKLVAVGTSDLACRHCNICI